MLQPIIRDGSNEGLQCMFCLEIRKIIFELSNSIPSLTWSSVLGDNTHTIIFELSSIPSLTWSSVLRDNTHTIYLH